MSIKRISLFSAIICLIFFSAISISCEAPKQKARSGKPTILATYAVLGSVVRELVGDTCIVESAIPDGLDPHEWEPSARDIESIMKADLIVENGLRLEGGMEKTLAEARKAGVSFFTASDYIQVRRVGSGEGIPSGDPDQAIGAEDPHLWMDPLAIKAVVEALASRLTTDFKVDLGSRLKDLVSKLDAIDVSIRLELGTIPAERRVIVTGHESLGYFAERYGLRLIGAIVPSLSSQAESSASELAALVKQIKDNKVRVIFTETGTSPRVAESLARESGTRTVELVTHKLPKDGSYLTFIGNLAGVIAANL